MYNILKQMEFLNVYLLVILEASLVTLVLITKDDFKLADSVSDLLLYFDLLVDPSIICSSAMLFHNKI